METTIANTITESVTLTVAYLQAAAAKGVIPEYLLVDFRFTTLHVHPGCCKILAAHGLGAQLK